MFRRITRPLRRWLRRLSVREPKAENVLRDRTRAHIEIAEALSQMAGTEGWQRLVHVVSRNKRFLSSKTLMLTNALLFVPPNAEQPDVEFLKRRLQLIDHLREELQNGAVDKEPQEQLRSSKEGVVKKS